MSAGASARKRVLFLSHRLPYPPDKGDKIRSFFELETLARSCDVDLFSFYDYAEDASYEAKVKEYCREFYAEPLPWFSSRRNAAMALLAGRPFTLGYFYSKSMQERVQAALRANRYDLAFVFCSSMAQYVEGCGLPRVMDMVDVDSDKWLQYAERVAPPRSWLWSVEGRRLSEYEVRIAREFDATLLCTEPEAEVLRRKAGAANIRVLGNRVDESYWNPQGVEIPAAVAKLAPYVIFTGSMDYMPNVDAAEWFTRECMPGLKKAITGVKFVVAGRNPTKAVQALAADPAVIITGSVADMRPYLSAASVAVAPLRVARGIQNKVLEAMAMGLPVVATTKVAAALPEKLRARVAVEDTGEGMARQIAAMIGGGRADREGIRRDLLRCFGQAEVERELMNLLSETAEKNVPKVEAVSY